MKTLIIALMLVCSFYSCEKEGHEKEKPQCPSVSADAVPQDVKTSFQTLYPTESVLFWFEKDPIGYCAYFKRNDTMM
jgi:hypothetical protein